MNIGIFPCVSSITQPKLSPVKQMNFGGKLPACPILPEIDKFEGSCLPAGLQDKIFEQFLGTIDSKIQNQLCKITPKKLEISINKILKAFPNATEKQVLTVMQRLTQWADYTCLSKLAQLLDQQHINRIEYSTPVNQYFCYFQSYKRLFPKNNKNGQYYAHIVTKKELNQFCNQNEGNIFINLEGFDDGINLFTDNTKLEEVTSIMLKKVQKFMAQHPGKGFEEALGQILNGRIVKTLQERGFKVKTLRIKAPADRKSILEQMSPCAPSSKEEIRLTIETVAEHFTKTPDAYRILRNNIANYYANKLDVYTKQRLIESLKLITKQIDRYVTKKNIQKDNVFYIIPSDKGAKSFGVITHMFASLNNIPPSQILRLDNIAEIKTYPENSAFVILDDIAASGLSLSEAADYHKLVLAPKINKHILFCPIIAHEEGIDKIFDTITRMNRQKLDAILTVKSNIKKIAVSAEEMDCKKYFYEDQTGIIALGYEGFKGDSSSILECTVFPYMTPDNNPDLASFITQHFLPSKAAIPGAHINLEEINLKLNKLLKKLNKTEDV